MIDTVKTRTTPFAPWGNGETERMNQTLPGMLKRMINENPNDWDRLLQKAVMHYRSAVNSSTKFTPFRLMFGREMRLPVDAMIGNPPNQTINETTYPEYVQKQKISTVP